MVQIVYTVNIGLKIFMMNYSFQINIYIISSQTQMNTLFKTKDENLKKEGFEKCTQVYENSC